MNTAEMTTAQLREAARAAETRADWPRAMQLLTLAIARYPGGPSHAASTLAGRDIAALRRRLEAARRQVRSE